VDIESSAREHGVSDDDGTALVHAMQAQKKLLNGMGKQ
jgi:hypothetical protein